MSWLSKIFGSGDSGGSAPEAEDFNGYHITPTPIKEGGTYRLSARIEREIDGELRSHTLIRADTMQSHDEVVAASIAKARQVIDEQGDRLFG